MEKKTLLGKILTIIALISIGFSVIGIFNFHVEYYDRIYYLIVCILPIASMISSFIALIIFKIKPTDRNALIWGFIVLGLSILDLLFSFCVLASSP